MEVRCTRFLPGFYMKIYLDNAATSYPKPQEVYAAVLNYMINIGGNPGRGGNKNSLMGNRLVFNCRKTIADFFNFDKPQNVIFTNNITSSLNILLKSTIKDGWHIITSVMEHNSVLRPLTAISSSKDIELDIIPCSSAGVIDIENIKSKIKENTKLIVLSHSSNVTGAIQPLKEIGKLCREKNIYFIIDSAQTAGVLPLNFNELNCNALAFTGHKSLFGPQGIGGFLIDDKLNSEASTIFEGGTGSLSESLIQPDFLPDKFESGTLNTPGIAGLLAGINFINKEGLAAINEKESYLRNYFIEKLLNFQKLTIYNADTSIPSTAVVSINSAIMNNSELGYILDNEYGIMTRTGLHCAPLAHKNIDSFPDGTLRFSIGYFNEIYDINYTIDSLYKILKMNL